ncbi:MAG TPA: winged helix-turn-helix domain-containing protein [Caulobacteraceae bacterium]|nr:winged helix-turn-helix domain-containing protein [Caulobacteraceae bacterium]
MSGSHAPPDDRRERSHADAPSGAPGVATGVIVLGREAAVRLGPLTIEPALRRVVRDGGGEAFLEPRVMQALVAMLRAGGGIVSRDDLLALAWGGVVVGEDAINRVIGRLRRLSEGAGAGVFRIETITKVGYRLVAEALARPAASGTPTRAAASRSEPLLAVLAFDNLSGDPDFLYFSDGVSEEILHTVARRTGLKVVGRSSSFQLRGSDKAARRVADELGATHLLDGSVRRSGDMVRVTAQLVECAGQTELWSHRFDRALTDIFALQDDIAAAIATALNAALAPSAPHGPIDPIAYDLYLRARTPLPDSMVFDIPLLERAVARAPEFAEGWALLAFARAVDLCWDRRRTAKPSEWAGMRAAAERALTLDPQSGIAHLALATGMPICGRYAEQHAMVAKALALAPNEPIVLVQACGFDETVGRQRAALAFAERAYELDPRYAATFYAAGLEATGRREEGFAIYDRAIERWPDSLLVGGSALKSAYDAEDWARYARLRALLTPEIAAHWIVGALDAMAALVRDWDAATGERLIGGLRRELAATGAVSVAWIGKCCARGLADEIYDILEAASFTRLFEDGGAMAGSDLSFNVLFSPAYAALRADPRFARFCDKLGFCDFWVGSGLWPDCADEVDYDLRAEATRLVEARRR